MKSLCCIAFDALCNKLKSSVPTASLAHYSGQLQEDINSIPLSAPLFVTWDKNGNLRGCIGTFQPQEIESGVRRFALTAGFQDSRFPPIKASEIPSLEVSVTLLANFTPIKKWDDWTVGDHGLKLTFSYGGQYYSGTFLPSVAPEQGWDQLLTVWNLLRKADFGNVLKSRTAEFYQKGLDEGWLELERYDGLKSEMSYADYETIKEGLYSK